MACSDSTPPAAIPQAVDVNNPNPDPDKRHCFELREGSGDMLSITSIWLELNGDSVNGGFNVMPFEKDQALGTLTGRSKDGQLECTWHFSQEGMEYESILIFKLEGDKLLQRQLSYDENTGEAFTPADAPFSISYPAVNCDSMATPELIFR